MASLITVRLNKGDAPNWGFRLQGGKDFGTALVVQKVIGGSPAERAGLIAGDSVIKINTTDVFNLRHKDAQDVVVRAGPAFEMTIQRGGSTWKPHVVPTGSFPTPSPVINNFSPVTKTSLAAHQTENIGAIGTGHNLSAKPFNTQVNGAVNGNNPKVVNKQYNTPLKLYSEESIAETLSAQTEVLSTGALGVNFKKNEKNYDASNSAVFRMLQEAENDPRSNDSEPDSGIITAPNSGSIGLRHVQAPENRPAPPTPQLPPGQNICADCERLIVGVFVRIKDKNLHVECFKCATCGSSLKNVGYYNINQKLYCDIHAKLAARNNPPAPNLVPVTVQPGARVPANAISAALASHSIPAPLSPKPNNYAAPFQHQETKEPNLNVTEANNNNNKLFNNSAPLSFDKYLKSAGNFGGAKPFSSVSAPLSPRNSSSTLPRSTAAPLSPVAPAYAPSFSPASSAGRYSSVKPAGAIFKGRSVNIVWPPVQEEPDFPTASPLYFPPPSQIQETLIQKKQQELEAQLEEEEYCQLVEEMAQYQQPTRMSLCSEEMSCQKSQVECVETISESLETKQLVDHILKTRPMGPPPIDQDIRPTGIQNPQQNICCQRRESDLRRPTQFTPNTIECELKQPFVENTIPQKWESPMVQALRTAPEDAFHQIPTKRTTSKMGSALATAPAEPFTALPPFSLEPVPLPEETVPYFPPEHPITIEPKEPKPQAPDSQFVKALKIAPERPFTPAGEKPVKKKPNPTDKYLQDLPKPQEHLSMLSALTTAPDRAYTPLLVESMCVEAKEAECKQTKVVDRSMLNRPIKPAILPASFQQNAKEPPPPRYYPRIMQQTEETRSEEQQEESSSSTESKTTQIKEVVEVNPGKAPVVMEIEGNRATPSNFPPIFQGFSCSFQNKTEHSQFSVEVNTTPPICTPEFSRTPVISASTESVPQVIKTQTITEETQQRASSAMKKESQQKTKVTEIEKQAEEVVIKKPLTAATLHKPESLPSYQVSLSESVEADLQMMKKMEAAQLRHEQQKVEKVSPKPPPAQTKPIITIQPGEGKPMAPQMSFQPVVDRPQSTTFSPRPRPLTPSMINKAPGALPYYQANLVATQQLAVRSSLLDPKSPNASRSPSPCPDRGQRASSPFPSGASRAKSPAPGPPENPLKSASPLPTPRDSKIEGAKKSLSTFIPQYKSKMDLIEARGMDYGSRREEDGSGESSQMYTSQVQLKTVPYDPRSGTSSFEMQKQSAADMQRSQMQVSQVGQSTVSTAISQKAHMEQMEQKKQSERRSVETSADGSIQVQRKKIVMEEYEHTQKENVIQIEKNVSCMKKHPFHDVNPPVVETHQGVVGMHITNPQPLASKFLQARLCENICAEASSTTSCCQKDSQCAVPCDPPPSAPIKHVTPPQPPTKHVTAPGSSKKPNQIVNRSTNVPLPNTGTGGGRQSGAIGVAPKRGRGILNVGAVGSRIAQCGQCHGQIRGPFITALGRIWCPEHFICATPSCRRPLQDMGFVEERGQLYCEYCFEQYLAPPCSKCNGKIKEDCLKAIGKNFHPECFNCVYCGKTFGNNAFFLEDGSPYCEADWNELFTTKCYACGFPVEAGDRWVEALNNNYHSQCFNCTMCKKNLEGQSFFAKGGRPFCKNHAR